MEELISKLFGMARGMWRHRWWGLLVAWVVVIAGGVAIYKMPDSYRSSARVFVDTQSVLRPLMSGLAVQPNVDQQIAILSRTLISRPNVEKLITLTDYDLTVGNVAEREKLISSVMTRLSISSAGRGNLFNLSFRDEDPARAQRVVQALLTMFVESGLVGKRQDSDAARRFIDEQIVGYEQKLIEAENRVKEFQLRNMALFGDGGTDYVSQIAGLASRVKQAELELREAEFSRDSLKRQLAGEDPVLLPLIQPQSDISIPELDGRIDALKKALDGLMQRYTEEHPDVVGTRRIIGQLEEQKAREIEQLKAAGPAQVGSIDANPVFQQMRLSLSDSEARVAALRARVVGLNQQLDELRAKREILPALEAERAQLNRDYNVHKRNYEQLVSRRESAAMSVEMSAQSGIADFRIIDPPTLPTKPSEPDRVLLFPVAGLAGLGGGFVLTFLLVQLRPSFSDARHLRAVTGLPVLGTISMLADPAVTRRKRLADIGFGVILFLYIAAVAGAVFAVQSLQR